MQILIVEDHEFNAFCLTKLLQATNYRFKVSVVNNSSSAKSYLKNQKPDLIILDGDLCAQGSQVNGPDLANYIWLENRDMTIVAWTDSVAMREDFAKVFSLHQKSFDQNFCWPKFVNKEHINQLIYHMNSCENSYAAVWPQKQAHYF